MATVREASGACLTLETRSLMSATGMLSTVESRARSSSSSLAAGATTTAIVGRLVTSSRPARSRMRPRGASVVTSRTRFSTACCGVGRAVEDLHRPQPRKQKPEDREHDEAEYGEAGLELLAEVGQTDRFLRGPAPSVTSAARGVHPRRWKVVIGLSWRKKRANHG